MEPRAAGRFPAARRERADHVDRRDHRESVVRGDLGAAVPNAAARAAAAVGGKRRDPGASRAGRQGARTWQHRTQAGRRRDRRDRSIRGRRRAPCARHARDCGGVRAKRRCDADHPRTYSRVRAAEGSALRSRGRRALQRNFGVYQEHARQRSRRRGLLDDADGRGGRGSAVHRAADGDLRVRRCGQRRSARAASRDRGQGSGGLRRDAGRA